MPFTTKTDTPDLVQRWPYDFQRIGRDEPQWNYLSAYASELRHIDVFIDELYEQRFVETATGRELEKLGAPLGITRRASETEDEYKFRVKLGKTISASDGTAKDIAAIMATAFGEDELERIDVSHSSGQPVTQFLIPSALLDEIPPSRSDFEDELERAFPAGHGVSIVESDTWLLGRSGSQGLGEGGLL